MTLDKRGQHLFMKDKRMRKRKSRTVNLDISLTRSSLLALQNLPAMIEVDWRREETKNREPRIELELQI